MKFLLISDNNIKLMKEILRTPIMECNLCKLEVNKKKMFTILETCVYETDEVPKEFKEKKE